jgi:D-sedoheptulose 7-phosphate isomerase
MTFTDEFVTRSIETLKALDQNQIEAVVDRLVEVRERQGRLFLCGSGGGAGHASHATCDFRKLCNIESYAPYDNVSELTARVNDDGWETTLVNWLKVSRIDKNDGVLIFSVGGGSESKNISMNLVNAVNFAKTKGATVVGIVGKDGGHTAQKADACVVIPPVQSDLITPLAEGFQAVIWHLLVSHPKLQINTAKWESVNQPDSVAVK